MVVEFRFITNVFKFMSLYMFWVKLRPITHILLRIFDILAFNDQSIIINSRSRQRQTQAHVGWTIFSHQMLLI